MPRIPQLPLALLGQGYSWSPRGALGSSAVPGQCCPPRHESSIFSPNHWETVSCCPHIPALPALGSLSSEAFQARLVPCAPVAAKAQGEAGFVGKGLDFSSQAAEPPLCSALLHHWHRENAPGTGRSELLHVKQEKSSRWAGDSSRRAKGGRANLNSLLPKKRQNK